MVETLGPIGPTGSRVAVVLYANFGKVAFYLDQHQTRNSLDKAIDKLEHRDGNTNTSGGKPISGTGSHTDSRHV